jgi:KaiC/GvpD/RAD55 family RecA-like ATPase
MGFSLVFCSRCGASNKDNAVYCNNCREPLRVRTGNLDNALSDLSWKLRRTLSSIKLSDYKWLNRLLVKEVTDDEARVERFKYLIERIEYSVNNPTKPSGIQELDDLLYGGIPSGYSILLTSPPLDEKDHILECFLRQGVIQGETVLLLSTMLKSVSTSLVMNNKDNFYLMLCSPWAENIIQDMPNVLKFHGVEDLTQLNISLKVFIREILEKNNNIDRVVLDLISDSLLMHETRIVRRWLMDLLTMFKQLKITTLSTIDPGMHSSDVTRIIIDLFDGHINLVEKRVDDRIEKKLKIKRLYNKKYQNKDLELKVY